LDDFSSLFNDIYKTCDTDPQDNLRPFLLNELME
jgi:hypothetical protein